MSHRSHTITRIVALALTVAIAVPAIASAKFDLNPPRKPTSQPPVQVVHVSSHNGFDWGDAAIGAATGLGLALLIAGGVMVAGRRRDHYAPTH